jgi:hypothetical protein
MSQDDELFDHIGEILQSHPGWRFEPSATPGAPPSWCLDVHGEITLSVNVDHEAITVYLPETDQEIAFDGIDGFAAWNEANEGRFLRP